MAYEIYNDYGFAISEKAIEKSSEIDLIRLRKNFELE